MTQIPPAASPPTPEPSPAAAPHTARAADAVAPEIGAMAPEAVPEANPAPAQADAIAEPPQAEPVAPTHSDWQRLPARAIPLCTIDISLSLAVVVGLAGVVLGVVLIGKYVALASGLTGALLGAGIGMWIGFRRYRNTLWRLDEHGFAVRRGVAWRRETLVPLTRVQHLDLKHGPLQRMRRLATLVVHTAGTRHSAVAIDHLDADDAQRLRERLGRQLDHEDDEG
ncbi:MAG: PH domain-containing protein [Lysobacter sp.]